MIGSCNLSVRRARFQLLSTADASTRDVTGLHCKLDRLRGVETTNATAQQQFCTRFTDSVRAMSADLGAFSAQQQQATAGISARLGRQRAIL